MSKPITFYRNGKVHKISNQDFIDGNIFKRADELEAKSLPEGLKTKLQRRKDDAKRDSFNRSEGDLSRLQSDARTKDT